MHILIVGGGIAGLSFAYCCRKAGLECTVVEKTSSVRTGGYMIDFFGPGDTVAERQGVLPDLEKIHTAIRTYFPAPAVSPATIFFWKITTNAIRGIELAMTPAASNPQGIS